MEPISDADVELIADYACETGEGPLWHEAEQRLYWVDIPAGRIFRYDPAAGRHDQVREGGVVGGFTIQADGALLLFLDRGTVATWRDGEMRIVIPEIPAERRSRFNDVIADPEGRVFCGTMPGPEGLGRLYRLDPDCTLTTVLEGVDVSNGMGFTPDLTGFYYTESNARTIYRFDYDRASGALSHRRAFVTTPAGDGVPDGMAVDTEGHVWSARWDGNALYRYSPAGQLEWRIPFPAKKVSSVTFGGPDYDDAYVTTAGGGDKAREGPGAGALFRSRLGVRGRPPFRSRIGL